MDIAREYNRCAPAIGLIHGIDRRVWTHVKAPSEAGHVSVPAALDDLGAPGARGAPQ
jgi:hypothetical protein